MQEMCNFLTNFATAKNDEKKKAKMLNGTDCLLIYGSFHSRSLCVFAAFDKDKTIRFEQISQTKQQK